MIQEDFKKKIRTLELEENERIMSETEICEHYGVSRITAVKALNNLAEEGYIKRIPGKGSFVNYNIVEMHASKYYSFTEEMIRRGLSPSTKQIERKIVSIGEAENAQELMERLLLGENDEVFFVKRVRFLDGVFTAIDMSYIPLILLSIKEKKEMLDSDYRYIDAIDTKIRKLRNTPTRAQETFSIEPLSKEDAVFFNTAAKTPVMKIARTTYSNDEIIEYNIHLCYGTRFHYRIEIKNVEHPPRLL
jgi:GntR family transcriptional regulator